MHRFHVLAFWGSDNENYEVPYYVTFLYSILSGLVDTVCIIIYILLVQ